MAMRKIGVGTLVSVEQESTGHGRRRPSEGGIGFVVKHKKQRRMEDKNGETPVVELTQQSTTSTTTAGTGATMFDIRYSLDGHLSQEVNKGSCWNAGHHQDGKLLEFINDEFQKRGWLLKFQPSNSPVTNVKDDCLFPALSKHISREQGINKGSQIFTPDELWAAVKQCWHNFPLDSLAQGYIRHAQMASALVACNGGDDFV